MSKWRKKPIVVEAFKWTSGPDQTEDPEWIIEALSADPWKVRIVQINPGDPVCMEIMTLEGCMLASPGDYIIQGIKGEIYPCKEDIFKETYEPVIEE